MVVQYCWLQEPARVCCVPCPGWKALLANLREALTVNLLDQLAHDEQAPAEDSGEEQVTTVFGNVYEFFEWFRYFYQRRTGTSDCKWRADWWTCPEAEYRLTALWRSWEKARYDPAGVVVWWRDYADPTMSALMSPVGPFAESSTESSPAEPLPSLTPPPGRFRDERADERQWHQPS
ncbi:DUF4913 domain-containing protein [Bifidobacterium xylocopae]|uniref:DUF4913 domain-containing protein n=1 Tax=Bifidobacterium xylocopae TaxID=2493119 RepID=UPI0038B3AFB9